MAVVKDETKVSVDLVTVQETWEIKATVIRATKMFNFSRNIAAKLVEKRCCTFYIPHTTCLSTKKCVDFVAESRTDLYCLQNAAETCDTFFCCKTGCTWDVFTRNIAFQLVSQQCCATSWTFLLLVNTVA